MISVCIATYNGEKYILQQLDSILSQLSEKDEVIVSDDNSTDSTLSLIEAYDPRIKILKNSNRGVISNFENALLGAKGDVIFLADQDDVWLPNKVKTCLEALKKSDLVVSDCYVTDQELQIISDSFYETNASNSNKYKAFLRNSYLGCCMAFNRSVLDVALPFPKQIPMHDIWIGNVAAFKRSVRFLPDKLIYYRRHGDNASTASEKSQTTLLEKLNFRTSVFVNLLKRRK